MIAKTITLTLGGQERTLLYGVNGYFEYIQEITNKDPFDWLDSLTKTDENKTGEVLTFVKDTAVLIYAGLNSYLDSVDQPNVPFDKVKKWCKGIRPEDNAEVFKISLSSLSTEKPGEEIPNQSNNGQIKVNA